MGRFTISLEVFKMAPQAVAILLRSPSPIRREFRFAVESVEALAAGFLKGLREEIKQHMQQQRMARILHIFIVYPASQSELTCWGGS